MILFSKKTVQLVPLYLLYMIVVQCAALAAHSFQDTQFATQIFTDKVYCYLLVPPFMWGISMIDESMKKPCLVRMKSRIQALLHLLIQQYLFALLYLGVWFFLIPLFAHLVNETISIANLLSIYIRYLFGLFLFANLSELLKRMEIKAFRTIPFIVAYLILLLDIQAIKVITNQIGITVKLVFSWTFYQLGIVILPVLFVVTFIALLCFNSRYDIF